ncbi:hypothetical protein Taro_038155 [Colocasia esculenta]|uniref:Uncharacterized protein n=1 Tax=Colocasia esculenta TaxID=4460 RepID=A0A843W2M1_COLES|nr:hypothetical protein [Colocasia esculenta]
MVAFKDFRSVATPSISRITVGAHTRSRPVTVIGSRVQLDARSPPQYTDCSTLWSDADIYSPGGRNRT